MNIPEYLSRDEVRQIDARAIGELGLPGVVLMENAGRGATDRLEQLGISGPVVVCAGKGNNGGDGFVMARHLGIRGYAVHVLVLATREEIRGDAEINLHVLEKSGTTLEWFLLTDTNRCTMTQDSITTEKRSFDPTDFDSRTASNVISGEAAIPGLQQLKQILNQADWVIDALLGTGMQGAVREPLRTVIEMINSSGRKILAVDLPSGLDCDSGEPLGTAIRANHTVTFVAKKRGFSNPNSRKFTGTVDVVDIGAPCSLFAR